LGAIDARLISTLQKNSFEAFNANTSASISPLPSRYVSATAADRVVPAHEDDVRWNETLSTKAKIFSLMAMGASMSLSYKLYFKYLESEKALREQQERQVSFEEESKRAMEETVRSFEKMNWASPSLPPFVTSAFL
jgi:mitochondrial fission protein ELM1